MKLNLYERREIKILVELISNLFRGPINEIPACARIKCPELRAREKRKQNNIRDRIYFDPVLI